MNRISKVFLACACSVFCMNGQAQSNATWTNDFSNAGETLKVVGRGTCSIADNVFRSKGAYAVFGHPEWKNYSFSFKARAPKNAEQVQIWASFRNYNRFDRYVVGIKGGLQDDLYLMRTGYMGTDEFMGVRPLGFHPVPGEWYRVKVEVCGNRIRIFLNDEKQPHIDLVDKNADLVPSGEVALGGGWIETEFDDLTVTPMADDALKNVKVAEYQKKATPILRPNWQRSPAAAQTSRWMATGSLCQTINWTTRIRLFRYKRTTRTGTSCPFLTSGHQSASGCMAKRCPLLPVHNPKVCRTPTTNRKPTAVKTIHSIIAG